MLGIKPPIISRSLSSRLYQPRSGDGCVLWLLGQDDAYSSTIRDRSGYNNHGTITGATWARLPSGLWALNFDGDDFINCGTNASLNFAGDWTFLAWVYFSFSGNKWVFGKDQSGGRSYACGFTATRQLYVQINGGSTYTSTTQFTSNSWQLAGWQYNRTAATIQGIRNGVLLDSVGSVPAMNSNPTTPTYFGARSYVGSEGYFVGNLGLGKQVGSLLSGSTLLSIFNQERPLFGV